MALIVACTGEDPLLWLSPRAPALAAGIFSIVLGLIFYALWLSEVVPAMASGTPPPSLAEVGLITKAGRPLDRIQPLE